MNLGLTKQLRILPVNQIKIFEKTGDEYQSDAARQALLPLIKHPFRVLRLENGGYLLLEGTALLLKLKSLGLNHVPAHICEEVQLVMQQARIKIIGFHEVEFLSLVKNLKSEIVVVSDGIKDTFIDGIKYHHSELSFSEGGTYHLKFKISNINSRIVPIDSLFNKITSCGYYMPEVREEQISGNTIKNVNPGAWMTIHPFKLKDLITMSDSDNLLPPSIVKIDSSQRIYNIDFPASVLKTDIPLKEKEAFLRDLIICRRQSYRTDSFEGHVFILNR